MSYQIGDFSKIVQLSVKTLRFYHEEGILEPSYIDKDTGYRFYDKNAFERARIIRKLKELDFSLRDIKEILAGCNDDSGLVTYLSAKKKEIADKVHNYNNILGKLEELIIYQEEIMKTENIKSEVIIKDIPDMLVAGLRYKGTYQEAGIRIGLLARHTGRYINGKPFSLYYDAEYKEDGADIEICFPVSKEVNTGDIKSRVLKGGRVISLVYRGGYETISDGYKMIFDRINGMKLKTLLPSREIYLKGPGMIFRGNPRNYLTELQLLLE